MKDEHTLRSLLNKLACLTPKIGVKRASSFNRDLRVHMAKKLPEMVVQLSLTRNIHFESEFRYKIGDTKVLKGVSPPRFKILTRALG